MCTILVRCGGPFEVPAVGKYLRVKTEQNKHKQKLIIDVNYWQMSVGRSRQMKARTTQNRILHFDVNTTAVMAQVIINIKMVEVPSFLGRKASPDMLFAFSEAMGVLLHALMSSVGIPDRRC